MSTASQLKDLAAAFRSMKAAFVPAANPAMQQMPPGQPPMDPAAMQQMPPPMDPAAMQQMPPPMDPAAMQQMPPPPGGPPPELADMMGMMDQLVTVAEQNTEKIKALEELNANLEKGLMQLQLQMEALSKQIEETGSEMPRMLQDLTEVKALQNMQQQPQLQALPGVML